MSKLRTISTALLLVAAVVSLATTSVNGARIDIINQCGQTITACATCAFSACGNLVNCYVLNGRGGRQQIDVSGNWPGGIIWGFPGDGNPSTGNVAKPQANLAEFTIGGSNQDFYAMSNVNAYNFPMRISPTQIAGGGHCGTIICAIDNLNAFCTSPNRLTGPPGYGCMNVNGPGTQPTAGTKAFKKRCPNAYSYSTDASSDTLYTCPTGSNYEVVFCPYGSVPGLTPDSVIQEVVSDN